MRKTKVCTLTNTLIIQSPVSSCGTDALKAAIGILALFVDRSARVSGAGALVYIGAAVLPLPALGTGALSGLSITGL